jgi:hypothetical protein
MAARRAHAVVAIVALVALLGAALVPATADAKRRPNKISRSFKKLKKSVNRVPKKNLSRKQRRGLQKKVRKARKSYKRGKLCKALFLLNEMREPARDPEAWKRFSERRSRKIEKRITKTEKLISKKKGARDCTSRAADVPDVKPKEAKGPYPAVEKKREFEPRPPNINNVGQFREVKERGSEAEVALPKGKAARGSKSPATAAGPQDPVSITQNSVLDLPQSQTGAEVSVASAGNTVFYTGNWFAAFSSDGGTHWNYVNPWTTLPNADGGFCCDQEVIYSPTYNRFFWILEYLGPDVFNGTGDQREGRLRIAVASPQQIVNSNAQSWTYYDLPSDLFGQQGQYFDFSHPALGTRDFYLSWLVWGTNNGNIVARLPLSEMAAGQTVHGWYLFSKGDWYRPVTQNASGKALFARQKSLSELEVFSWDQDSTTIYFKGVPISTIATEDFSSMTPAGNNWLSRFPPGWGTTAAARSGNEAWFAWSAARGVKRGDGTVDNKWPNPHIEGAVIDVDSLNLKRQFYIWNPDYAFRWPALTSSRGEVAMSFAWGGKTTGANAGVGMISNRVYLIANGLGSGPGTAGGVDYAQVRPDVTATRGPLFPFRPRGPAKFIAANFVQQEVSEFDPRKETTTKHQETRDHFIRFQR